MSFSSLTCPAMLLYYVGALGGGFTSFMSSVTCPPPKAIEVIKRIPRPPIKIIEPGNGGFAVGCPLP